MQGRALVKDRSQHFRDNIGVHWRAGADDLIEVVAAFQHHQCAGAGVGKLLGSIADSDDGTLPYPAQGRIAAAAAKQAVGPDRCLAHALQRTAQLRLEDDHRRRKGHGDNVVQHPGDGAQIEQRRKAVEQHQQRNTLDQLTRAGFARELNELVKRKGNDQDIKRV